MPVIDPPGERYGRNYYAVYFTDTDGIKLEAMIWAPPPKARKRRSRAKAKKKRKS